MDSNTFFNSYVGYNKFPLAPHNQPRRPFKGYGIILADAGFQVLHDIGKIALHNVALPQLAYAQLEPLRRYGNAVGYAVDTLGIRFADTALKIHKAGIAKRSRKAYHRRIADMQPLRNLRCPAGKPCEIGRHMYFMRRICVCFFLTIEIVRLICL